MWRVTGAIGDSAENIERAMEERGMRVSRQKMDYLCIGEGGADKEV